MRFGASSNGRRILPTTEAVSRTDSEAAQRSLCLIGRNRRGLWVVRDPIGMCGGVFTNRTEAFRFATQEGGPHLAVMVPYRLELDTGIPTGGTGKPTSSMSQAGEPAARVAIHG